MFAVGVSLWRKHTKLQREISMTVKCKKCGKNATLIDDNWICDKCKVFISKKMEIYSRVVGYLRPVSQWNKGKQQEFEDRVMFDKL